MNEKKVFYITTTLPYVNADPHIGFALEIVQADALARFYQLQGCDVFFNTGTDEHGLKIYCKAIEEKKEPQAYVDEYAAKFDNLKKTLNLSYNNFIRTTDAYHKKAAQEFWQRCKKNGDIYQARQKIKYCVGCELEKTESELLDGKCPLHPSKEVSLIDEENYFFRFSKYQKSLLQFYKKYPDFVIPKSKFGEIKKFISGGLKDFSISRLKKKMPWGVAVPGDPEHVMYVWFDALVNYISALGWPENEAKFTKFWGTKEKPQAIQVAGKDNLRQQTAIWQAMLISAGMPNSRQVFIHGFITANNQKMSKSLGNVINPLELVRKYGTDATRFFLLKEIHPFKDSDFTYERFEEVYNANLANGLGNLVSRVLAMVIRYCDGKVPEINVDPEKHPLRVSKKIYTWKAAYKDRNKALKVYKFNEAMEAVFKFITTVDRYIDDNKPWELFKKDQEKLNDVLYGLLDSLYQLAWMIYPFLPETSLKIAGALQIKGLLKNNPDEKDSRVNIKSGTKIVPLSQSLFPRI